MSPSAAGSSPTDPTCADASRGSGACSARLFHVLASVWVVGPVQDTQCGFKGFSREAARDLFARQRITSIVFDVELIYLARRRGYRLTVVPIRWFDRRGSRMQPRPGLAAARGLGPVPDPVPPSRGPAASMTGTRIAAVCGGRDRRSSGGPARGARSSSLVVVVGAVLASGGSDTLGYDSLPISRPLAGCSTAARSTTRPSQAPARSACSTTRRRSRRWSCRSRSLPAALATWAWIAGLLVGLRGRRRDPAGRRPDVRWAIVLLAGLSWPFVYAIKLGQVGPILFLLFAIGWRWLDRPVRLGVAMRARGRDQAPAGAPPRVGAR